MQSAQAAPRMSKEAIKDFHTIYPQYIDANLTPAEGRRVTKAQGVPTPTPEEIAIALRTLGFRETVIDPRASYPKSQGSDKFPIVPRGCIRVRIKEPASEHYVKKSEFDRQTRNVVVPGLESKHQVLVRVAALIKERNAERPTMPTVEEVLASTAPNQPRTKK